MNAPGDISDAGFTIRTFSSGDEEACKRLYTDGLIGGSLAQNDTALDIDDIAGVYLKPGSHFWVAVSDQGTVVGMVGVQHHDEGTGEIRRLRVLESHRRRGIGSALVEQALAFCEQQQYLKITLDTFMEHEAATRLFEKFRFRHQRSKKVGDRELRYFYLDLYGRDKPGAPKG
jgi:ribosomal protein S18 acetylase RimI-like enzyme